MLVPKLICFLSSDAKHLSLIIYFQFGFNKNFLLFFFSLGAPTPTNCARMCYRPKGARPLRPAQQISVLFRRLDKNLTKYIRDLKVKPSNSVRSLKISITVSLNCFRPKSVDFVQLIGIMKEHHPEEFLFSVQNISAMGWNKIERSVNQLIKYTICDTFTQRLKIIM